MKQNFMLTKINEIKFEVHKNTQWIRPLYSVIINKNTFAFVYYHYETEKEFIKFFSYINNNFILIGQYNFNDNNINERIYDFKVEKENLIILTKKII